MIDTIVIGAGQAGLSVGYYLKQLKQEFLILDKGKEVGESWINRYDSLVLFTPRMYDALPGLPLEGDAHGFPNKNEIVSYLKQYANEFNLPIQLQTEVIKVQHQDGIFYIETLQGILQSKNLIIATGAFQTPRIPAFSQKLSSDINQLHSSQYKNPVQLKEGNVLVVGGGNSGAQIAVELSKEKETYLAISKKLSYLPLVFFDKSMYWWLDQFGILKASTNSFLGKVIQKKGDPIFGFELKDAIKRKEVFLKPRVMKGIYNEITFKDSTTLKVDNIIWATGFDLKYPWLELRKVFNEEGEIVHQRGITNVKGLYFIGLPWQYRRGSAILQGVGFDAKYIVEHLKTIS
ncbi:oxidoreductase [Ureibacillus massiliensis 4400831 = CIP 108448 = CCUG 49529]|uniref:Oxidoreductase n=1 Tax=Ureibacillus massiliensis 4400831 = CIP 108448 = CCUG 49529 TaxID=1211035 RepID=A0A0A3IX79_9BACL|nr:NAD(P)/FAD-dependent oxidoreductase [Ureibacillus massiliensis]KGR89281.1 oxidoreductase [Ureibacillus massiliensis 4400831 = CIP 108448 = CCUG 49529]